MLIIILISGNAVGSCSWDAMGTSRSASTLNDSAWEAARRGNNSIYSRARNSTREYNKLQSEYRKDKWHLYCTKCTWEHVPRVSYGIRSLRHSRFAIENIRLVEGRFRLFLDLNCPYWTHHGIVDSQAFISQKDH